MLLHLLLSLGGAAAAISSTFSPLSLDPPTINRLNGESFQQDAVATFNGFQYAAFYGSSPSANVNTSRHVSVARRPLVGGEKALWETLTLTDYDQTLDDGHDVISLGICHNDGTIHLSFDQHDNPLNYRVSKKGVATNPTSVTWDASLFGPVVVCLFHIFKGVKVDISLE